MKYLKTYNIFENFKSLQGIEYHKTSEYSRIRKIADNIEYGKKISDDDIDFLDNISDYPMFYSSIEYFVKDIFNVFNKYDFNEISEILSEYFTQIPEFEPYFMFSISSDNMSIGISESNLNDKKYFRYIVSKLLVTITSDCINTYGISNNSIDKFYETTKPTLYIDLNKSWGRYFHNQYNLLFLENLAEKIYQRFDKSFDLDGVSYEYDKKSRRYDPNIDVYSYNLKLFLK